MGYFVTVVRATDVVYHGSVTLNPLDCETLRPGNSMIACIPNIGKSACGIRDGTFDMPAHLASGSTLHLRATWQHHVKGRALSAHRHLRHRAWSLRDADETSPPWHFAVASSPTVSAIGTKMMMKIHHLEMYYSGCGLTDSRRGCVSCSQWQPTRLRTHKMGGRGTDSGG